LERAEMAATAQRFLSQQAAARPMSFASLPTYRWLWPPAKLSHGGQIDHT
jgi:hypothetical protein